MRWQFIPTNCNEEQVPHRYSLLLLWKILFPHTLSLLYFRTAPFHLRPPLRTRYLLHSPITTLHKVCENNGKVCGNKKEFIYETKRDSTPSSQAADRPNYAQQILDVFPVSALGVLAR